jgi:tetratricopeptide (TPR) repeat protein
MNIENIKDTLKEAYEYHKAENFEAAEKLYRQILDEDSNNFGANYLLGSLFAQTKNLHEAKLFLQKSLQIDPNYADAHYNLGNVFIELKEIQEAIICFKKSIEINPENADANNNLGNLLKQAGKIEEAENLYKKAIEINPNYVNAYNNLGTIFQKYKDFQEAIKLYKKTIQLDPAFASAYNNLGLISHEIEEHQNAINYYEKAIKFKPDYAEAYSNLAKVYKDLGNFKETISCFENVKKYDPDDLIALYYLSEFKNEILNSDLKKKIINIINNKNCTKINLAYGNFLLSFYEFHSSNYKKEIDYLLKGHDYYFESQKEKFKTLTDYWMKAPSEVNQLINSKDSSKVKNKKNEEIKPIFIIGVPRCGSTLVEKVIVSGTKHISVGEETGIFHNVVIDIINKNLSSTPDLSYIEDRVLEKYNQKKLLKASNDYTFTDKSLENTFYLQLIKEIFPNSKVIYCKRKPLSCIMSILKNNLVEVPWAHNLEHIFEYFDIFFKEINNFKDTYSNFIYDLDYEKFVTDPAVESKKLLSFCNVPWDKSCLEFYKRKELISHTASNIQIRQAIYKHAINKYLPYNDLLSNYGNKYSWFH